MHSFHRHSPGHRAMLNFKARSFGICPLTIQRTLLRVHPEPPSANGSLLTRMSLNSTWLVPRYVSAMVLTS